MFSEFIIWEDLNSAYNSVSQTFFLWHHENNLFVLFFQNLGGLQILPLTNLFTEFECNIDWNFMIADKTKICKKYLFYSIFSEWQNEFYWTSIFWNIKFNILKLNILNQISWLAERKRLSKWIVFWFL